MSIPINTDNSVQLGYSSFPFAISDIDNYATSNFVSNVSNALRTAINTKQDTLTASTTLLGVGTSITAIDYNKISVNKPTYFPTDWTSTIANKPTYFPPDPSTYYNKTEANNLLNAKQNTLTAATALLGTGGSITGINYNTVINKPTYSTPLSSNIATNNISIDLSNYYNQTQVNTAITNASNYASNISNVLKSNIDIKDNILSFSSPLIRTVNSISFNESTISTLTNFYNKTEANNLLNAKQATLSFSSPLVNTANTINFNESSITSLTNFYNKTEANNLLNAKQATLSFSSPLVNTANTISINLGAYSTTGTDTNYLLKSGGTMSGALTTPNITLGGTSGKINVVDDYHYISFNQSTDTIIIQEYGTIKFNIGQTKTTKAYINSSGLTATAFYGDGANITSVPYSTITGKPTTFPADLTNYYNQTQTNTIITNTSNYASNISNVLLINYNSLNINTSNYASNISNVLLINYNSLNTTTNINSSNYASNVSNVIITNTNANYLKLSGGDLTGTLNIKTGTSVIHFGTRIIDNLLTLWSDGASTYGIGINSATLRYNAPTNTTHRFYTGATNTVTIDGSGNVGIGITNPFASLSIGTPALASDGTLTISRNSGGNRNFKFGYDSGFNFCMGDFANGVTGNIWRATDLTINWQTGNVGIGISGQSQKLYINGSSYINGASTVNGTLTSQILNLNTLASGNNVLFIRSANSGANNCIQIQNDLNRTAYIGLGGSAFAGGGNNYVNNLFIESANGAIILNTNGRTSTSTPNLQIRSDGHIETSGYIIAGTNGTTSQGLRIGGWDTGNTLYQDSTAVGANMGFTLRNANSFNFNSYSTAGAYTTMLTINTNGIRIPITAYSYSFGIADWYLYQGTAAGTITNSFIFWHSTPGVFNSKWWFNGTQTNTNSEISDERIKKEIKEIETPLNKLMTLKPKEYYLCDDKDYNKKFGIIAQDVEQIFPEFIHTENNYIANIFSCATYDNNIITIDKDISNLINIDDELKLIFDNANKNNLEIAIDDTPYNNRYKRRYVKVVEIIDNHSFKIDIELEDLFDDGINTNNIFIYGKKVDNFKRLDYESLYCLNIAATQELYKLIELLQNRISILEARLN